jgi:hypothetical protein
MSYEFQKVASRPVSEAEEFLTSLGINYKKQPDGSILVPGGLDISNRGLTKLPDLSRVTVRGDFWCHGNKLTTLEGAPQSVGGDFSCYNNRLMTLTGAPQSIGGDFWCAGNRLANLKGAPRSVGGGFYCYNNRLVTLEGGPLSVGGVFYCAGNRLTTLKGAPQSFTGDFSCCNNPLVSLSHAPRKFNTLQSDFGDFASWAAIPENLRNPPVDNDAAIKPFRGFDIGKP